MTADQFFPSVGGSDEGWCAGLDRTLAAVGWGGVGWVSGLIVGDLVWHLYRLVQVRCRATAEQWPRQKGDAPPSLSAGHCPLSVVRCLVSGVRCPLFAVC